MRILHTADWHLNHRLGRIDRNDDICRSLERIAGYLEEYHVDVMVVAGDLFDRARPDEHRQGVATIREIFLPFLARGGTMIAISGNHDSEIFFETLRDALDLVAPGSTSSHADATGRLYIAPRPRLLRLPDSQGGIVQFVLMPYPTARCYLRGEQPQFRSLEERHRAIQGQFRRMLNYLRDSARGFDVRLPSVLVSHVHVRGVQPHPLFRLTENEDVVFEPSDIPAEWAYVAYGHIHRAQEALAGAKHVRYAGSVERLDLGERFDQKSVVLVDIGPNGLLGEPATLPLPATPIYRIEITDPETQIPRLAADYAEAKQALVNYILYWQPGVHDRDALCHRIHQVFPRWYDRDFVEVGRALGPGGSYTVRQLNDVAGNVREYLAARLKDHPQYEELMNLAESLLAEEGVL